MSDTADGPLSPERLAEMRGVYERYWGGAARNKWRKDFVLALIAEVERLRQDLDEARDELNTAHLATVDALADAARLDWCADHLVKFRGSSHVMAWPPGDDEHHIEWMDTEGEGDWHRTDARPDLRSAIDAAITAVSNSRELTEDE